MCFLSIGCIDHNAIEPNCNKVDANCGVTGLHLVYAAEFLGAEKLLSEGGLWFNVGEDWTFVQKKDGLAFGTRGDTRRYDDWCSVQSGFQPDCAAWDQIHIDPQLDPICNNKSIILQRWSDVQGFAQGSECLIRSNEAYAQIVRWNDPKGGHCCRRIFISRVAAR